MSADAKDVAELGVENGDADSDVDSSDDERTDPEYTCVCDYCGTAAVDCFNKCSNAACHEPGCSSCGDFPRRLCYICSGNQAAEEDD
jgi:hypothetical protein